MGMFFGDSGKVARRIGCGTYEEIDDVYDRFCNETRERYEKSNKTDDEEDDDE